jgi:hypothetical protein
MGSQFGLHPKSICYTPQLENPGKKPEIGNLVEPALHHCAACQAVTPSHEVKPLQMGPLPNALWIYMSGDLQAHY